jgi:cysteine desulfurase
MASSTWEAATPARDSASRAAAAPSCAAVSRDSAPPNFPMGVRTAPATTTSCISCRFSEGGAVETGIITYYFPVDRIYLDHNATTPVDPRVVDAMTAVLRDDFGNPSSIHWYGQQARARLDEARAQVARLIGATPSEIVFTGSGTEADNMALRGALGVIKQGQARPRPAAPRRKIVYSAVEHHAIMNTAKALAEEGWPVEVARVGSDGVVDLDDLRARVDDTTAVVAVMRANNETGVIQPVEEVARIAHAQGALVHCDGVQAAGKIPIDVGGLDVDMLALSAHKFHGPKGVGMLYVKRGTRLSPWSRGGSQERGRRAGTENVAGIVGLGQAAALAAEDLLAEGPRLAALRDDLERRLLALPGALAERRRPARAEHAQHLVRRHRGGEPADGPRPRRHRGVHGRRLRRGRRRAVPRPARHGPAGGAGAGLDPLVPRTVDDSRRHRPHRGRDHDGGRQAARGVAPVRGPAELKLGLGQIRSGTNFLFRNKPCLRGAFDQPQRQLIS